MTGSPLSQSSNTLLGENFIQAFDSSQVPLAVCAVLSAQPTTHWHYRNNAWMNAYGDEVTPEVLSRVPHSIIPWKTTDSDKPSEAALFVGGPTNQGARQSTPQEYLSRVLKNTKIVALGEISAGLAHEINNPLTVIQGRTYQIHQMLENKKLDAEIVRVASESISKATDRIAKLIRSMRSFARDSDQGENSLVSVSELIEESLDFCKTRFQNYGIELRVAEIPIELEISCRIISMEQAILNALSNAFDAVLPLSEKWVQIDAEDCGNHIEIRITDSGLGIPSEIQKDMFQPFFTTKEIGKGAGLGLTIAENILKAHGGEVRYESTPHTRFIFLLPKPI